ncbi:A disintegrin and metalloproteinase with thrombospondin motifs 7 [Lampris incognitus]|uniref:A disintegrin and metalloproteinase with thrombospondin motifs 7 n=1 Tax=Lampris incognitus TaxID=2546036 RepID=UPI0024B62BD6|nr:A disintegrin and metalloproteinase with thrombospondin motifs 7 [Lampris incognitus]
MTPHWDVVLHITRQSFSPVNFFIAVGLLTVVRNTKALGVSHKPESFLDELLQYEVVHPIRVDAKGRFLSNFLPHHASRIQRRDASTEPRNSDRIFYQLRHGSQNLHFNLTLNPHLLAPGFLTERRFGGIRGSKIHSPGSSQCLFLGEVWDQTSVRGRAAISTCDGLTGMFKLSDEDFFIRPLELSSDESTEPQPHVIYKRHASSSWSQVAQPISGKQALNGTCGVKDPHGVFEDIERQRERWERRHQRKRSIRQRSVSKEKWVEVLVVADPKMVEYHGSKGVESYVLAVMNIVSGVYRDANIGNAINIVVVRLIILEEDEDDLKITHHADNSLNSFCKWQKGLNMNGDEHPLHHDVAVLITRKDICAAINKPCETLGLSHVAGMCQPHRSCSISEDTGLPLAFTIAHELGHNFGIQHDGNGNDCEPIGKRPFVMSPQLLYGTAVPSWSRCSREYITRFLDRGWGWCLDDMPVKDELSLNSVPPGVLYNAAHQCRLQYGSGSLLCDDVDNVCSTLWCTVGTTCHSKLDGAVDGTSCGEDKWCFGGECVAVGYQPERVSGGWASWSEWSACSRTCGAGVQNAQRDCVNPVPKYGGKYCLGERRRYKICNTTPCLNDQPNFRDIQCGHFNTMPYKGQFYKWVAVNNRVNPCELHCRPLNEYFSEKMLDAVADGTRCYEGSTSRDMCINGICKNVGCDYVIDSNATEDRCGVCHGNGSTCTTVKKTFDESEGLGYVDIGLIPEGAWDIRIEEVAEAGNFLALRSDNPDQYFLNGGWTIQWNGDYKAAGTVFTYERTGHLENLTSPGPTMEPLWIQLLFQETNPGVRYEYTIRREFSEDNDIPISDFFWKYGSWTECSVTCGSGVHRQIVHCVEKTSGIVEERFCDPLTRPDDKQASCNKELCPAIWWVGEWQKCSSSCGSSGLAKRTVLCIQGVGVEEQRALQPTECKHMPKPEFVTPCNTHIPCPADWTAGTWSECSVTCGGGTRHRNVTCSRNTDVDCDPQKMPTAVTSCYLNDCPHLIDIFGGSDWSGSGLSSKEVFNEINSIPDANPPPKYATTRAQPKNHNDLNNIIEADLSHHNHIEKADHSFKSNVQVDDFYYDYNFINFHEDLSYDFDTGNNQEVDPPQKPKANNDMKENIYRETTIVPVTTSAISTISNKTTAYTEEVGKPQDQSQENFHESTGTPTKKPAAKKSEKMDDFLSEDYFLPVSTTLSPTLTKGHDNNGWPRDISPGHSQVFTTDGSPKTIEQEQHGEEVDNNSEDYNKEESHNDDAIVKIKYAATTLVSQTSNEDSLTTSVDQENVKDFDNLEYHSHEKNTVGSDTSGSQRDVENLEPPLGPPSPETVFQHQTAMNMIPVQAGESTLEIPLATTPLFELSKIGSTASIPKDFDSEEPDFDVTKTNTDSQGTSRVNDSYLRVTSHPATQDSTFLPVLSQTISGKHEASDDTSSITGTDSLPPTEMVRGSQPSPFLLPTDSQSTMTESQVPTQSTLTERTMLQGRDVTSRAPYDWSDFDYNDIVISSMLRNRGKSHPPTSYSLPMNKAATQQYSTTPTLDMLSQEPSTPTPPIHAPTLWPVPALTSTHAPSSMQVPTASHWIASNWSACSTTCGLGAIWRTLTCSTGSDSDCDPAKRPIPARRCYLRPCSTWKIGEWSKCSKDCGNGVTLREVQCFDMRDERPLRPFHCQAISPRPRTHMPCNPQPCLDWYKSSWGQCSEVCGGGEQQRMVTCPEDDRCDQAIQPGNIQPCNNQSCVQWLTGSWGQCSASCGGGVQHRLIKCVNTKAEAEDEVDQAQCDHEPRPDDTHKCNLHECESAPSGMPCIRDRLTFRFCQTLQWLGRCNLPTVQVQCCKTCSQRSRGNSRISRR